MLWDADNNHSTMECWPRPKCDDQNTILLVINAGLCIVYFLLGLGNIVVFVCLYKESKLRTTFNYMVCCLAVSDFVATIVSVPLHLLQPVLYMYDVRIRHALCTFKIFATTFSIVISALSIGGISFCRAFIWAKDLSKGYARAMVFVEYAIGVSLSIFMITDGNSPTIMRCINDTLEIGADGNVGLGARSTSLLIVFLLAFCVSVVSYSVLFCKLRHDRLQLGDISVRGDHHKLDLVTAKTGLVIAAVYVWSLLAPFIIPYVLYATNDLDIISRGLYRIIYSIVFLQSSVNPVIYSLSSKAYNQTLRSMLRYVCCRKQYLVRSTPPERESHVEMNSLHLSRNTSRTSALRINTIS